MNQFRVGKQKLSLTKKFLIKNGQNVDKLRVESNRKN